MIIKNVSHNSSFTQISNSTLQDGRLSWKAQGLLTYLLSLPSDWEVHTSHLSNVRSAGRDAVRRMLDELEELGYAERVMCRDDRGQFAPELHIREVPETESPAPENPAPAERPLQRTYSLQRNNYKNTPTPSGQVHPSPGGAEVCAPADSCESTPPLAASGQLGSRPLPQPQATELSTRIPTGIVGNGEVVADAKVGRQKKSRSKIEYPPEFEAIWAEYPRKADKAPAFKKYLATTRWYVDPEPDDEFPGVPENLAAAAKRYGDAKRAEGTETRYIKHLATFFGTGEHWREWDHDPEPTAESGALAWTPTEKDLANARIWDDWDEDYRWTDASGRIREDQPPFESMPSHPAGGLFDSRGRRYRKANGRRVYDSTRGPQKIAEAPQTPSLVSTTAPFISEA